MNEELIIEKIMCPSSIDMNCLEAGCRMDVKNAVNSVAIITGKAWKEVVKSLVEQACIRGNMPQYKTCVTDMMRANGFVPVKYSGKLVSLIKELNASGDRETYIVNLSFFGYYALCLDEKRKGYMLKGRKEEQYSFLRKDVNEIWKYVHGTDNRTGIEGNMKKREEPEDGERFMAKNMNPKEKNTGDCSVRALSAAYNCSWVEAIRYLAEANHYETLILDSSSNIDLTLATLGFEHHKLVKRGGQYPDGNMFCIQMN